MGTIVDTSKITKMADAAPAGERGGFVVALDLVTVDVVVGVVEEGVVEGAVEDVGRKTKNGFLSQNLAA